MTATTTSIRSTMPRLAWVADGRWAELAPEPLVSGSTGNVICIRAADLERAQRMATAERTKALAEGRRIAVFLDLEFHLAADARRAFEEAETAAVESKLPTVRYVGTRGGLLGLLRDIVAINVADGVTLLPLSAEDEEEVRTLVRVAGG